MKPTQAEIEKALYKTAGKRNYDGETQLVKSIQAYLGQVIRIPCFRRNVGAAVYEDKDGRRRLVKFGTSGQVDLWAIGPHGIHIEIEAKLPGNKPTALQEEFLELMRKQGAIAIWCDSLEGLADALECEYGSRGFHWEPSWRLR